MFHAPRWSPDGRWIVLSSNIGGDEEIWVTSADGAIKRQLTDNDVNDSGADWTGDGRAITFVRETSAGPERLMMDPDGANVRPATRTATHAGRFVVEERKTASGQAVYAREARTGAEHRLSTTGWAEQPAASPDGQRIIFEQRESAHVDIMSSDVALWDARSRTVTVLGRGTDPSWFPDGRRILFKAPGPDKRTLWITIQDLDRGTRVPLAPGVHPHLSPDGRNIVFMNLGEPRSDVYLMAADDGANRRCLTCGW